MPGLVNREVVGPARQEGLGRVNVSVIENVMYANGEEMGERSQEMRGLCEGDRKAL